MTSEGKCQVDFDDFADSYEDLLQKQLSFFSSDRGYFSDYKAQVLYRLLPSPPARILDFGCGIGLTLPYLAARFPGSKIHASDISRRSLQYVARTYPQVEVVQDECLGTGQFDLILTAGVFHHVPPRERAGVIRRIARLLAPGGMLCVFEHNPYNPLTRHLVSTCPFDADAHLISRREMRQLLETAGLITRHTGYCLFFPPSLARLKSLEPALGWLPLGGQYFVLGSN